MRLRRDPRATEYLAQDERVVQEPTAYKGKWHTLFGNDNPIHVEFGCGKGGFITELARRNPDINYVAAERAETVVYKACKKANSEETPDNLVFVFEDMAKCLYIFEAGEIDRLYLNFSDPWPKKRHAKKRITYREFLKKYAIILGEKGEIHFKTDNEKLFEFSLNEIAANNWLLKNISLDLGNSEYENNVTTEYEDKFMSQGMRIFRCEAKKRN